MGAMNSSEIPRRKEPANRRYRVESAFALGVNEHRVGARRALPILAGVHRVITPAKRGDATDADFRQFDFERFCVNVRRARRHVAPVQNGVDENVSRVFRFRHSQQREQVFRLGVNFAVA
jgi:hypothetical protein